MANCWNMVVTTGVMSKLEGCLSCNLYVVQVLCITID